MSAKTPRELIADIYAGQKMIDDTYRYPNKYSSFGWTNESIRAKCQRQIKIFRQHLRAEQNCGEMEKERIRSWLVQVRQCADIDTVSLIQVHLQNAVKAYILEDEESYRMRRENLAFLFVQFYRSGEEVTADLVDAFYQQMEM